MSSIQSTQMIPTTAHRMIVRAGIKSYTETSFSIPEPIVNDYFWNYYLLYWSGKYIVDSIQSGLLNHNFNEFTVRYNRELTRGKILANPDRQYALSFRVPKEEWNIAPVVIISEAILPKQGK